MAYTYLSVGGDAQNNVNKGSIYIQLTPKHERERSQQEFEALIRADLERWTAIAKELKLEPQ